MVLFVLIGMGLFFYYANPHCLQSPPITTIVKTFAVTTPGDLKDLPNDNMPFELGELKLIRSSNNLSITNDTELTIHNTSTTIDVYVHLKFNFSVTNISAAAEGFSYEWNFNKDTGVKFKTVGLAVGNQITSMSGIEAIVKIPIDDKLVVKPVVTYRATNGTIMVTGAYIMIKEL
ncbi:MAG: hypothetical protein EHM79_00585 [Geobacter sp.]|nr:MAG: hypothetical protein EHM79_00585 [Geobacter sp.]